VSAAGGGELQDECVERLGQDDGLAAEPEPHVLLAGVNMVQGEAADRGGPVGAQLPRSRPAAAAHQLGAMMRNGLNDLLKRLLVAGIPVGDLADLHAHGIQPDR
jgi:hypothetical protein